MAFTVKYHRSEDRMTISFALPSGDNRTCWVTRRQWLMLILRLSDLAALPTYIEGSKDDKNDDGSSTSQSSSERREYKKTSVDLSSKVDRQEKLGSAVASDHPVIVRKIGVMKTRTGLRISFGTSKVGDKKSSKINEMINLNISLQERKMLLEAFSSKARQAGWDVDPALKRLRANQEKPEARPKSAMH